MFLSTGLKRVRLLGMRTHFFPKNLARGMLIRVGTFIRDTIVSNSFGNLYDINKSLLNCCVVKKLHYSSQNPAVPSSAEDI